MQDDVTYTEAVPSLCICSNLSAKVVPMSCGPGVNLMHSPTAKVWGGWVKSLVRRCTKNHDPLLAKLNGILHAHVESARKARHPLSQIKIPACI